MTQERKLIAEKEWFVGFSDASACFFIRSGGKGQRFVICENQGNKKILQDFQAMLNSGGLSDNNGNNTSQFDIGNKKELNNAILPIFDSIPLLTNKLFNYLVFKELLEKRINNLPFEKSRPEIEKKENNTLTSFQIIELPYFNNWLSGFISSLGSFMFKESTYDGRISPEFYILHKLDRSLMYAINNAINNRNDVYYDKNKDIFKIAVTSKKSLCNLIHFLDNLEVPLKGVKLQEYNAWKNDIALIAPYAEVLDYNEFHFGFKKYKL